MSPVSLRDFEAPAELLRALGTPVRLALVVLLAERPRPVLELVERLGVSQPLVSQHLKTLRAARLVCAEREGRQVRYRLADEHVGHIALDAVAHAQEGRP